MRIAQEYISPKDAPRKAGAYSLDQKPHPLNFIQLSIAQKVFAIPRVNDEVDSEWSSGEFRRKMRGCSLFLALILLPTLVPPLSVRCRAWRWRARAGNALVELSSLQHTGLRQCLVPYLAVRIEQECISPKDAP